jgi:mRNA-degrading endonuclease HigB of HigAB toxin-antitoxin module
MDILDIFKSKEIDIYISLSMTILGAILGVVYDLIKSNASTEVNKTYQKTITVNNFTSNFEKNHYTHTSNKSDESFFFLIILVLGLIYSFFKIETINFIFYTTVLIVSIWSGRVSLNLLNGNFTGWKWFVNIIFYILFFISSFYVIKIATTPIYAPENFKYLQEIINKYGITGLHKFFTIEDLQWYVFHFFGVLLLLVSMIRLTLSIIFFTIVGTHDIEDESNEELPWLALKTMKYANFWKNMIIISISLFCSYYLISGIFFFWFENDLPNIMNSLINTILNGR